MMTLTRLFYESYGIFSRLTDANDNQVALTLEHAYLSTSDKPYLSKIPNGTYTCIKGQHRLASMTQDFTTFEITGVPGHTNILFHVGNWNKDSEGCVLLGRSFDVDTDPTMILHSKTTFDSFMQLMKDVNSFQLTVMG